MVYPVPNKFTVRIDDGAANLLYALAARTGASPTRCATRLLEQAITAESGRVFAPEEPELTPEQAAAQERTKLLEELQSQLSAQLAEALPQLIDQSLLATLRKLLPSVVRASSPKPIIEPRAARELATEFLSALDFLRAVSAPRLTTAGRKEQLEHDAHQKAATTILRLIPDRPSGARPAGRTPDGRSSKPE